VTRASGTFDVIAFGASGDKAQNAQAAIQAAMDACGDAGGGVVYFPPGAYTTATIHLRSHTRLYLEAGATLFSSKDPDAWEMKALLYGEDLQHISIEGRGVIDGQATYEWRLSDHDDQYIADNQRRMEAAGKPLMRAFPTADSIGNLLLLKRCKDVLIRDVSFLDSPSWAMHPYACERLTIDNVYVHSSREAGVWSDGIDPDGCKDVRISNCTIDTGDDALVFYSSEVYGPALPCENITVTNCRLSSSSSALKFCDGIKNCVRNVTIDNCIISDSNRGIAFMEFDGGYVSDVVISNMTIECRRHDWFWWGDGDPFHFRVIQRSEIHPEADWPEEPPPGSIRNVRIENVIARGCSPSVCCGHADSNLSGITMKGVQLTVAADPEGVYETPGPALTFRHVRDLRLEDIEVVWEDVPSDQWGSALHLDDVDDLTLSGIRASSPPAAPAHAAVTLTQVKRANLRQCDAAEGTQTFLHIEGERTRAVRLVDNRLDRAATPCRTTADVPADAVVDAVEPQ
jgi:hypothetical protein